MNAVGHLQLDNLDDYEVSPGVFLIGNPTPRPDLGDNKMACLANVNGALCVVELSIKLRGK